MQRSHVIFLFTHPFYKTFIQCSELSHGEAMITWQVSAGITGTHLFSIFFSKPQAILKNYAMDSAESAQNPIRVGVDSITVTIHKF